MLRWHRFSKHASRLLCQCVTANHLWPHHSGAFEGRGGNGVSEKGVHRYLGGGYSGILRDSQWGSYSGVIRVLNSVTQGVRVR